ncbi:portal protein [Caudoviricetes sp.]|nr:portal protein [Caudoviricetes sp.]
MATNWALVGALLGGTTAMREAGQAYLPRWPKEEPADYEVRLKAAVLFPAYGRTVKTLAGKPFSKPITVGEDVPKRIQEWMKDIDLEGRNLDAFASDVMESALGYGLGGILVEYPKVNPGSIRTEAQERSAGLRPYWVEIKAKQILGWRAARVSGEWRLMQLRLMECIEEPDGDFGTEEIEQVRVLEPGKWATYRYASDRADWVKYESGVTTLSIIPFVPVYGGRTGFMTSVPPLLELAHLNVAHWQSASDQQNILHVARVPILTVTGVDETWTMTVGSSSAIRLPDQSEMKYVEHTGSAIDAGQTDLDKLEERMRQAGAELLVIAPGYVTATQVNTENAVGMCVLQRITQGFEDSLDQALQITADWIREATGGHVTIYNDYGVATLQEASAQLLLSANQAGKLSDETLHSEFQRRGILSTDTSWEEEKDRLDQQGPALGVMGEVDPVTGEPVMNQPPAPTPAPPTGASFDMEALIAAIGNIPAPVVNFQMPELPPRPQVEAPEIDYAAIAAAISPMMPAPPDYAALVQSLAALVPEPPDYAALAQSLAAMMPAPPDYAALAAAITAATPAPPQLTVEAPPPIDMQGLAAALKALVPALPPINVTIEKGGEIKFTEDDEGRITGAKMQ